MGLMIECPAILPGESNRAKQRCRERNPLSAKTCRKCHHSIRRGTGIVYWIEYRDSGRRKRERIGPSKEAAELRLGEIRRAQVEERHIDRDKGARMSLAELVEWYLALPEVKAKRSWRRDMQLLKPILRILEPGTLIKDLNAGVMDGYATHRLQETTPARTGGTIRPATGNKERMQLNTALNKAVAHLRLDTNPLAGRIKKLVEDNIRERVLSEEEFELLLEGLFSPLREMVLVAFYLAIRQGEILNLTWKNINLTRNLIVRGGDETKTGFKRRIPIHPRVRKMLDTLPRALDTSRVFLSNGKALRSFAGNFKREWGRAVKEAGLGDSTFHALRHCAINNLRTAGNDYFTIMAISGQRTTSVIKQYNVVTDEELRHVRWKKEDPAGVHRDKKSR